MEVRVNQTDLAKALHALAWPGRQAQTVRLEVQEGDLRLSTHDYTGHLSIVVPVMSAMGWTQPLTVDRRMLTGIVGKAGGDGMVIITREGEGWPVVRTGHHRLALIALADEQYDMGPCPDTLALSIPQPTLKDALCRVVSNAATYDSRPALTCVHFGLEDGALTLYAADTFRVARYRLPNASGTPVPSAYVFSLDATALRKLNTLLASDTPDDQPAEIWIHAAGGHAERPLHWAEVRWQVGDLPESAMRISALGQGQKYPDVQTLCDDAAAKYRAGVTFKRADLLAMLDAAARVTRIGMGAVTLRAYRHRLQLRARAEDEAVYDGNIPAETTTPKAGDRQRIQVALSAKYLRDALQGSGEEIDLSIAGPYEPVLIETTGDPRCQYLIMPIRIRAEEFK